METRLALTGRQYQELRRHLFPGDQKEAAALLLCGRGRGSRRTQLVGRRLVTIPHERMIVREHDRLEWPVDEFLLPLVEEMERDDLGVIVFHCHPGGGKFFSDTDDQGDRALFPDVHLWFDQEGVHGAGVLMPDGEILARFVGPDGSFHTVDIVSVAGDDIKMFRQTTSADLAEHARRLVQTFGEGTYRQLQSMKVAVIGCSGTGSIVIELLARNCVGRLVLVDDDRVELKNLNRILNSTAAHAASGESKVDALAAAVRSFGLGTQVDVFPTNLSDPATARAVAECDVVFGCMDTLVGRHVLNSLCSAYCLPLFETGVDIEPDGKGGIAQAIADAHYVQPGGSSLMSRGVYTAMELTAEAWKHSNPEYYNRQRLAGYLAKVQEDRPAVMPLNMMASNGAVIDLLARLHGFRLDSNAEFAVQRWSLTHGYYENSLEGQPCAFMAAQVGLADNWSVPC